MKKSIAKILRSIAERLDKQEIVKTTTQKTASKETFYASGSEKQIAFENFQKSEKIYYKLEADKKHEEAKQFHNDVVMKNYYIWQSL